MANILFSNNASAVLAANLLVGETTVQVAAGFGANFPAPTAPNYFMATLENDLGDIEVVKVTARTSDLLTIERAQEGTTAKQFNLSVSRLELRLTSGVMGEMVQVNGDVMTGDLDLNANNLIDAYINGPSTRFTQGQIAGVPLRGAIDLTSNEITVPAGGGRAKVGGADILAAGDDIMAELDVAGLITFDSATVGAVVPASAYLQVEGSTSSFYIRIAHDDTDVNITTLGVTDINIDAAIAMSADIKMQDNQISTCEFIDFAVTKQTVAAAVTTNIDYTLGSYVTLTMGQNITLLAIDNPPAAEVGSMRLKIVQDGTGGRTITFPANFRWAGGSAMLLSTAANAVDFLDLWTDDGGTTWYCGYELNWLAA